MLFCLAGATLPLRQVRRVVRWPSWNYVSFIQLYDLFSNLQRSDKLHPILRAELDLKVKGKGEGSRPLSDCVSQTDRAETRNMDLTLRATLTVYGLDCRTASIMRYYRFTNKLMHKL
jgi:hypothetical protein